MRTLRCFRYNLVQGFKGVFRNSVMSVASVLVLVSCMIILGTFYLVLSNIESNFNNIQDLNIIEARISTTASDAQIEEIGAKLSEICKESEIVREEPVFVSKDEHLARFKELYGDEEWSGFFNESLNPLRPSYKITFDNFSDVAKVVEIVTQIEQIKLSDNTSPFTASDVHSCIDLYRNVTSLKKTLTAIGIWLMAILLVISLFVIMNTIKLGIFARRNEVMFMRYCGATKAFIRTPFLVEGALLGLFSAALSLLGEYLLYRFALVKMVTTLSNGVSGSAIAVSPFASHCALLALMFCAIGLFAGLVSSSISLKKYLKV